VDADTNGVAEYEVESVLAQRGSTNRRELLIRWKGYGAEHDEWQPRTQLIRTAPIVVAEWGRSRRKEKTPGESVCCSHTPTQGNDHDHSTRRNHFAPVDHVVWGSVEKTNVSVSGSC
jgi:hypothetical protein